MKCKYTFKVTGHLKPDRILPIASGDTVYEYSVDTNGVLDKVYATVEVPSPNDWPRQERSTDPSVKVHFNIPSPGFTQIRSSLRVVEGMLSIYGLDKIDVDNPGTEWLPANDDEKAKLGLYSISMSTQSLPIERVPELQFDLFARPFLVGDAAEEVEVPLSFFRKGRIDIDENRYIEAIYDFYFMLETLYAEGKTKNYAVAEEFKKSSELLKCIEKVTTDVPSILTHKRELSEAYSTKYAGKPPEVIAEEIVNLRGFLHHHSHSRKDIWHPEQHLRFEIDALFLYCVAMNVALRLYSRYVYSAVTIEKFRTQFASIIKK